MKCIALSIIYDIQIKRFSIYNVIFVVQQLKWVAHSRRRDVTYDVTEKNAQECQTGMRRILTPYTLVYHLNK